MQWAGLWWVGLIVRGGEKVGRGEEGCARCWTRRHNNGLLTGLAMTLVSRPGCWSQEANRI